jgi:hypothetical protein
MMGNLTPDTARKIEHIAALRAEADHIAHEVLRTGERGTVTALMHVLNIASATVWNRYGRGLDRPCNNRKTPQREA